MALNNILTNEIIGIYIGNTNIKIILGNKNKIKQFMTIKTPENSVQDYNIIDIDAIGSCLNMFLKQNKITAKNVTFAIQGQDIIIRHVELPIMPEKNIRSSIEWEAKQYLPKNGEDYYIDFEILDKEYSNEKKIFKIMVAAVPKEKVDKYLRLSESLNLRLKAIDLTANCTARLFKNISQKDKEVKNIGVIDIGSRNSSIVIIENGKLFMEKTVPFGLYNIQREISKKKNISLEDAEEYMFNTLNFYKTEEDEISKRVQTLFDNLFSSYSKVIQFYTTGKASKRLDRIYLSSGGNLINGLNEYINDYFETTTLVPDNFKALNLKIDAPKDFELKFYANLVGLLRRKDTRELNLVPYEIREKKAKELNIRNKIAFGVIILCFLFICVYLPKQGLNKLKNKEVKLINEIAANKNVEEESKKINNQVSEVNRYTEKINMLNNNKVIVAKRISLLQKYIPKDLTLKTLSYNNGSIILTGASGKYDSIAEFAANLQASKEFKSVELTSINKGTVSKVLPNYNFSISIVY